MFSHFCEIHVNSDDPCVFPMFSHSSVPDEGQAVKVMLSMRSRLSHTVCETMYVSASLLLSGSGMFQVLAHAKMGRKLYSRKHCRQLNESDIF